MTVLMVAEPSMYNQPQSIPTGGDVPGTVSSRIFGSDYYIAFTNIM